ncbi:hypothetical protein J19TS2_22250 [Cohnella xylanilytica]|uniref:DUF1801 domain-containing protein n=1 Tax=Cohnella xylanilytica TaxID=557555 RepID=A0A841U497_9BACL|nr:DUF1801 domain-containing protein [Cohnella xylanilytica]MBB6695537.1 DUF1801 domain-containing protein [Cohnella xylanilytica]GIO12670.1 hypothetical protein J19TS2_22250 [Cohnella xylanilytica]
MKASKLSGPEQVADFLDKLVHPLKDEILEARRIILGANGEITEHIKWNAPSFLYRGEDRVTMNLQGKGFFRLVFHTGAKPAGSADGIRIPEDDAGLLEWAAKDRAILIITDRSDLDSKRAKLAAIVDGWMRATTPGEGESEDGD